MRRLVKLAVSAVVLLAGFPLFFLIENPKVFLQDQDTVAVREDGNLRLGPPRAAKDEAQMDLAFALMSQAAYQTAEDDTTKSLGNAAQIKQKLCSAGWEPWPKFLPQSIEDEFTVHHLRVQIWRNPLQRSVAVAFGGTDAKSIKDWISNLRWFIPRHNDEYTQVVNKLGPEFVKEYLRREDAPGWEFLRSATIFTTGHSLGGGLAQEFAYSLESETKVPRVKKVYAFDPSPVTGFYSVKRTEREQNRKGLEIDRIYQRREVLAVARSVLNLVHRPSAEDPKIRDVRYKLFKGWSPVYRHSIDRLSSGLEKAALKQ